MDEDFNLSRARRSKVDSASGQFTPHPITQEHQSTQQTQSHQCTQCSARNITEEKGLAEIEEEGTLVSSPVTKNTVVADPEDPGYARTRELRLEELAITRRWPTTQERRNQLIDHMFRLMSSSKSEGVQVRAASVVIAAERCDNALLGRPNSGSGNVTVNIDVHSKEAAIFGVVDSQAFRAAALRVKQEQEDALNLLPAPEPPKE